jgi:hypothetical protein
MNKNLIILIKINILINRKKLSQNENINKLKNDDLIEILNITYKNIN